MKQFQYVITDPVGIHARPAGLLVKAAKALDSTVTIEKVGGKSAAAPSSWLSWSPAYLQKGGSADQPDLRADPGRGMGTLSSGLHQSQGTVGGPL